jgi:predicted nucleic acid-binding protein
MSDKVFVDTNILVYSRDASEPEKQEVAMAWLQHLWKSRNGRLRFQVRQEYYSTVTTKLQPGMAPASARGDVQALFSWRPIPVGVGIIQGAWFVQDRFKLSWWDALIVSAAQSDDCGYLLTEDLQDGLRLGDVSVINPFLHSPKSLDSVKK